MHGSAAFWRVTTRGFTRLAAPVTLALIATGTLGCAQGAGGGDCLRQGVAQLGPSGPSSRSVTCAMAAERWIVALPPAATLDASSGVPEEFWPGIDDSSKAGYNVCEVSAVPIFEHAERPPDKRPTGTTLCSKVAVDVARIMVVKARTFAARIERTPTGRVVLKGLDAVTP